MINAKKFYLCANFVNDHTDFFLCKSTMMTNCYDYQYENTSPGGYLCNKSTDCGRTLSKTSVDGSAHNWATGKLIFYTDKNLN